jgi:hypothetical protein
MGKISCFKEKKIRKKTNLKKCTEENPKCRCCNSEEEVSAHHIINRSLGGDDSWGNLISLCFKCHRKAHDGCTESVGVTKVYNPPAVFMINVLQNLREERYDKVLLRLKEIL